MFWAKVLKVFGIVWVVLAGVVILAGAIGIAMSASGFWDAFRQLRETFSPFNVVNWLITAIVFAPGVGALIWAEKLKKN